MQIQLAFIAKKPHPQLLTILGPKNKTGTKVDGQIVEIYEALESMTLLTSQELVVLVIRQRVASLLAQEKGNGHRQRIDNL